MLSQLSLLLNPEFLIKSFGLIGVGAIIFAESGLFFGFFLPGDSLLLTAGLFASRGDLNIFTLILVTAIAAIAGDSTGYWFGRKTGDQIFKRNDSRFFKKSHLLKAQAFYEKHGGKTIILARFMPFVRTFAPVVAGAAKMDYGKFLLYNVFGGLLWGAGLPAVGYCVGRWLSDRFSAKQIDQYFLLIVAAVVILSVAPTGLHLLKEYALPRLYPNRKS